MLTNDISDCKEVEKRIRRLYHVHTVLRGIDTLIARVRNRDELLMGACWIAVETGAFGMAWIGVIDRETLGGRVVAWHGGEQGHIDNINLTAREGTAESEPPACRALRQLQPVICNDIATDLSLAPFRDELLGSGHKSAGYFPLTVAGRPEAVIALFAGESNFFEAEESGLLLDMTGNLSFALDHMENALYTAPRTHSVPRPLSADRKTDSRTPQHGATRYRRATKRVRDHWTGGDSPSGSECGLLQSAPV